MTATAITSLGEVTEVPEKARRRTYTVEYKLQIVKEADACKEPGEVGALLRREGLYSSHLTTWRQARDRGELAEAQRRRSGARSRLLATTATGALPSSSARTRSSRRAPNAPRRSPRFKKSGRTAGTSVPERGIVMETVALHGPRFGVARLCHALAVSRATYYRHLEAKAPAPWPTPVRALTVVERARSSSTSSTARDRRVWRAVPARFPVADRPPR